MTAIVSNKGELLFNIQASDEIVRLNTPEDCIAVEDPPHSNMFYANGWAAMPIQPSFNHIFDYDLKRWVDSRTIEEVKEQKWAEIKLSRDLIEFGGFSYGGNVYDSDQVSQGRILGAAMSNTDLTWTLQNNESIDLSANELKELFVAMQAHISLTHDRSRAARELIYSATTPEEVEAVNI